ncbi:hypothetical protein EJ05DRAFT_477937 [Pseudovirgaria hyperparasitica]|uniref:Transcription factor domain-containing protein n=1 Tax=Pseudovirgaria hyperparasitica TaxID=470096 RepID=A0A6A6W1K6_9PEZI|nr:uncharacterized protein EJ05DRAFT_477937 [Pseudovirgaria hyperparasitica]KAF2755874.1 hypothetical protein EJ05DRAFT_477937 [Pseudovirgaria hyperparasitica]
MSPTKEDETPGTSQSNFVWVDSSSLHREKPQAIKKVIWSRAAAHSHKVAPRTRKKPEKSKTNKTTTKTTTKVQSKTVKGINKPRVKSSGTSNPKDRYKTTDASSEKRKAQVGELLVRQPLPLPLLMNASARDPFAYTPAIQSRREWLTDFWYNHVIPKSSHPIKVPMEQLSVYVRWCRQLDLTEPALYYSSLFMASGIPVAEGKLPVSEALYFRSLAVHSLNEALNDPDRRCSTAVILAVGQLAVHEHVYGDRQLAQRVHHDAHRKMILMRGGIEALQMPPAAVQLFRWGHALLMTPLDDLFGNSVKNLPQYSIQEALSVVEHCSPRRSNHPGYGSGK